MRMSDSESDIEEDMGPEDMSFEVKDPNEYSIEEDGEDEMEEQHIFERKKLDEKP